MALRLTSLLRNHLQDFFADAFVGSRDVENLREHYTRTVEQWHERLVHAQAEVEKMSDAVRYRIFDLYLAGTAYEFRVGRLHLHQTLLLKTKPGIALPSQTRQEWYGA